MPDGWEKITRRMRRLFSGKDEERPTTRRLNASQVIRPEDVVPPAGKSAPPSTTRRIQSTGPDSSGMTVTETPWGVVHVRFPEPEVDETVRVRDTVTRRLSRRKLMDGMNRTTGFYNADGSLIDQRDADW